MRATAVVAWREIVEHRVFLVAAVAALAVTVVVPLLQGLVGWSPAEVREVLMWGMALGLTWLIAVFLGASMVSGQVAAGRFGFFMARPVGGPAIWFGKVVGVSAVVVACELIVLVPAAMLNDPAAVLQDVMDDPWVVVGLILGVPLLLILLAHVVGTLWRARTVWVSLDLAVLLLAGVIGWATLGALLEVGAAGSAVAVGVMAILCLGVITLGVGAVQVAAGRSDPLRHHLTLARTLWPALLVLAVGMVAYGLWLRHHDSATSSGSTVGRS